MDELDSSQDFIDIAREFLELVTFELDPHVSQKGEIKMEGENKIVLLTRDHIQFAVYGRGPGKKPPFDNILAFVEKENIQFEGTDQRGTAFAIQASIGRDGTKNWVPNAPNALEEAIEKNFDEYNKKFGDMMAVEIRNQTMSTYKKILPKSEFKF